VIAGIVPQQTKWPSSAPIIDTPVNGGKIGIKPHNPSSTHCADGGFFWFEWQLWDKSTATWKPLKMMLKPLKCDPAGALRDMSGLQPGNYAVRVKETNGKYNFESEWTSWVYFEIPGK
jgi:hypothetical protein